MFFGRSVEFYGVHPKTTYHSWFLAPQSELQTKRCHGLQKHASWLPTENCTFSAEINQMHFPVACIAPLARYNPPKMPHRTPLRRVSLVKQASGPQRGIVLLCIAAISHQLQFSTTLRVLNVIPQSTPQTSGFSCRDMHLPTETCAFCRKWAFLQRNRWAHWLIAWIPLPPCLSGNFTALGEFREIRGKLRKNWEISVEFSGVLHGDQSEFRGNSWGDFGAAPTFSQKSRKGFGAIWGLERLFCANRQGTWQKLQEIAGGFQAQESRTLALRPEVPATEAGNLPIKLSGEGAKGVLVYVDQKPAALVQKRVALVQNRAAMVQETLGRPFLQVAKTPFAPSPNHLGNLQVSGLCSRHLGSQR